MKLAFRLFDRDGDGNRARCVSGARGVGGSVFQVSSTYLCLRLCAHSKQKTSKGLIRLFCGVKLISRVAGFISKQEMSQALAQFGAPLNDRELDQLIGVAICDRV